MGTKVNSNYEDLLTFTRASKGHALRPVSYGDELVVNGDFATDVSGWTVGGSGPALGTWNSSGYIDLDRNGGTSCVLQQNVAATVGSIYVVSFDVVAIASPTRISVSLTGVNLTNTISSTGSYAFSCVASSSSQSLAFSLTQTSSATASIDNISVKEVFFDQPDGTLTLFEHPVNVPRVEWDSAGNRLGLLVEEARTNRVQYSTPDSNWNTSTLGTGVTPVVTLNNETSPDGTTSAAKVVLDVGGGTTSGDRSLFLVPTANVTATNSYAGSVWLKGETGGERVVMRHAGNATYSLFTLTTSWARYDVTETAASSLATMAIGLKGNQSDATATIYVWGAQIEEGSFPTSTIVNNSGSTTTRSADVASIPVADFGYNRKEGTLLVEGDYKFNTSGSGYPRIIELGNTTTSQNRIVIYMSEAGNDAVYGPLAANVQQASINLIADQTDGVFEASKIAIVFAENNFVGVTDGVVRGTDTSGTIVPSEPRDTLAIGRQAAGYSSIGTGHFKTIKYYPRVLTAAQLQALTEPRSTPTLSLTFDGLESSYTENYIHG